MARPKKTGIMFNAPRIGVREGKGAGQRTLKMVRPTCSICQPEINHPLWWKFCTHKGESGLDIYYTIVQPEPEKLPLIEEKDGRRVIVGYEEILPEPVKSLNIDQVPFGSPRINSGKSLGNAQYRGWIDVAEFGVEPFCEYINCYAQTELRLTEYGRFCNENQARLVGADVEEIVLEVYDDKIRRRELRDVDLAQF